MDGVCSGHAIVVLVFLVRLSRTVFTVNLWMVYVLGCYSCARVRQPLTVFTMLTCGWCLLWACYSCARLPCSSVPDSVYFVNLWMVSVLGML